VIDELPPYHINRAKVPCRWESKGRVMRMLNERYQNRQMEQVDGVKIDLDTEWVLILPDLDSPFFHVIAEGTSDEQARALAEKYAELVAGLQ
jgi:mannose-1-phosphate guanylyltransferase/phosphomannomutase